MKGLKIALIGTLAADDRLTWLDALQRSLPEADWQSAQHHGSALEVAVVASPPPGSLQRLPSLRLIQSLWAGVDRLMADPSVPTDVPLARMVDPAMNAAMTQTALWATLALHRGFFQYQDQQRQGVWQPHAQRQAREVPVLVLGLGLLGTQVAQALSSLGYPVTAWRLHAGRTAPPGVQAVQGMTALQHALSQAQVVINLLPLTALTRGLINADFLARLPPGAGLVNLARGAHVVDADLLQALDAGHLAHAVLDVFATEPLPLDHRFWHHPRVTVLPHVAALTDPRTACEVVADNVRRLARGEPLLHLVDRQRGY
jgi:glyoxylate/hydroxypyruvate reductase A